MATSEIPPMVGENSAWSARYYLGRDEILFNGIPTTSRSSKLKSLINLVRDFLWQKSKLFGILGPILAERNSLLAKTFQPRKFAKQIVTWRGGEVANTAVCRTVIQGCKSPSRL